MRVKHYNSDFELVEATRVKKYQTINNALEKARFTTNNKKGTYAFLNGGYVAELNTYTIIDIETGYCLNPYETLTYNECITLIQMYC